MSYDIDYTYRRIPEEAVPRKAHDEVFRRVSKFKGIGPRFIECTIEEGWFRYDRASGEFYRRVAKTARQRKTAQ